MLLGDLNLYVSSYCLIFQKYINFFGGGLRDLNRFEIIFSQFFHLITIY